MIRIMILAALLGIPSINAAQGAIVDFVLEGKAGLGLLPENENGPVNGMPGSGGLIGNGIVYDTDSNSLTIEIGWGSDNGYTDLSGNASAAHLRGPAYFDEDGGVQIGLNGLPGFDNSQSAGKIVGSVFLNAAQEVMLFDSELYISIHTPTNMNGELRGNLVAISVPEPSSAIGLGVIVIAGYLCCRRKRRFSLEF